MSKDGIMVDPTKIEAICDWDRPTSLTEVHSFISLDSYSRCFVKGFATISTPMTQLNQKEVPF